MKKRLTERIITLAADKTGWSTPERVSTTTTTFQELSAFIVSSAVKSAEALKYWRVANYELAMFRETAGVDPISPEAIENAITESKLLHIRNLCELFCDPDAAKHDDDIKLKDLFDDWETNEARYSQLVKSRNDLCEAYGKGDPSRRATLNKRLAHTTKRRAESDGYNYTELVEVLKPKILKVFEDIEALRK